MRCAVVEYNWYHDEVIPTLVYALNRLGFDVDVYLPRKALAADTFCFASALSYEAHAIDGPLGKLRGTPRWRRRYDLTIANSIEPVEVLRRTEKLAGPLLAIVHNASLLRTAPEYAAYFEPSRRAPVVLWPHVADYLAPDWKAEWIAPVYFGEVPRGNGQDERSDVVEFCVQGNFAFDRRNYDSLLAAVEELIAAGRRGYGITFVGRSDTPDGLAFRARLAGSTASVAVSFTTPGMRYRDYYSLIAGADYILPLVDTSTPQYGYYYADKATSSLAVSIGLGVVPIIQSRLAQLYKLSDAGICYEDGRLAAAMAHAIVLPADEIDLRREALAERRETVLAETVANLRRAVEMVS